ncbi:MAG: family 16 glycosylhydrolase [Mucilaginibacter sp.]|nr:family 16 glycosylhydrolase [Mucilaginibacter sp.]
MKYISICVLVLTSLFACKKVGTEGGAGTTDLAPTNLAVTAVINPDNSGNVTFTAAASNAITFDYDFGNGTYQTVASGIVTYRYPSSGTYVVNVIAKSNGGQTISKTTSVIVTVTSSLSWSDEFNVDGAPDGAKWGYDLGAGGWGNNELEYYTNRTDNAYVSNGTLKIVAKKESFGGSNYTSARLTSYNKFSLKYGKLEIRAKLPVSAGTWPAIWTLGSDFSTNTWPACGEMDIMEQTGADKSRVLGTLHYPGHSGGNGDGGSTVVANATSEFHIYAIEWNSSSIKISVDGVVYKTVANSSTLPFNHNFFIILNIAMGGSLGGSIDPNFTTNTMEIDYVRYYQ